MKLAQNTKVIIEKLKQNLLGPKIMNYYSKWLKIYRLILLLIILGVAPLLLGNTKLESFFSTDINDEIVKKMIDNLEPETDYSVAKKNILYINEKIKCIEEKYKIKFEMQVSPIKKKYESQISHLTLLKKNPKSQYESVKDYKLKQDSFNIAITNLKNEMNQEISKIENNLNNEVIASKKPLLKKRLSIVKMSFLVEPVNFKILHKRYNAETQKFYLNTVISNLNDSIPCINGYSINVHFYLPLPKQYAKEFVENPARYSANIRINVNELGKFLPYTISFFDDNMKKEYSCEQNSMNYRTYNNRTVELFSIFFLLLCTIILLITSLIRLDSITIKFFAYLLIITIIVLSVFGIIGVYNFENLYYWNYFYQKWHKFLYVKNAIPKDPLVSFFMSILFISLYTLQLIIELLLAIAVLVAVLYICGNK